MYDLVIIGANIAGIVAAQSAIQALPSKRIALVCQGEQPQLAFTVGATLPKALTGLALATESWSAALSELAAAGVDVVPEAGAFVPGSPPMFKTESRQLQAIRYLLASGYDPEPSPWLGLAPSDYLALDLFRPQAWNFSAQCWAIVGATPVGVALAQTLAQQGKTVYLLTRNAHLLPAEDQSLAHLLQVYLQVLGVTILPFPSQGLSFRFLGNNILISYPEQTLLVEQVVRSYPAPRPQGLNLAALGLDFPVVTTQFQTPHPALYLCGPWLGGYALPSLVLQESRWLGLRLLGPALPLLDYRGLAYGIASDPPWFRVGFTEAEAKAIHGPRLHIQSYTALPQPGNKLQDTLKIIASASQQFLGAHWLGAGAAWGISLFAQAYQEGWTLDRIQPHLTWIEQQFQPLAPG